MSSINIYVSDSEKAELKRISAVTGKSASDLVREMITALSAQHPNTAKETIHLVWELRDITQGKNKTKAWVSKDGKCYILRSENNLRLNLPSPCDTDWVRQVNPPYYLRPRFKIKVTSEMIYDTFVATKHINVCDGSRYEHDGIIYEHDGIIWQSLPSSEYEFYIKGEVYIEGEAE